MALGSGLNPDLADDLTLAVMVYLPLLFLLGGVLFILWKVHPRNRVNRSRKRVRDSGQAAVEKLLTQAPIDADYVNVIRETIRQASGNMNRALEDMDQTLVNARTVVRREHTRLPDGWELRVTTTTTTTPEPPPPEPPPAQDQEQAATTVEPGNKPSPTIYERLGKDILDD